MYLDGAKLVWSIRIIVHYSDKVVSNVEFLTTAMRIRGQVCRHEGGHVEYHLQSSHRLAHGTRLTCEMMSW